MSSSFASLLISVTWEGKSLDVLDSYVYSMFMKTRAGSGLMELHVCYVDLQLCFHSLDWLLLFAGGISLTFQLTD